MVQALYIVKFVSPYSRSSKWHRYRILDEQIRRIRVQLVSARRRLDVRVLLQRIQPARPPRSRLGRHRRPSAARVENGAQTHRKRGDVHVDEAQHGAEKVRAVLVSGLRELVELRLQARDEVRLTGQVCVAKKCVKGGEEVGVDLGLPCWKVISREKVMKTGGMGATYMVDPEAAIGFEPRVRRQ